MEGIMEPDSRTDRRAREVIGAAIAVHSALGPGFLESVYQRALEVELKARGIPFEREKYVEVLRRGVLVGRGRCDFVVDTCLVVELKAIEALAPVHSSIIVSYLRAAKLMLALLINFNVLILKDGIKRIIVSPRATQRKGDL
ncbi:MAG: hypothetical protein A2X67_10435 [Ignavibacteria bacterium GWA2_55_11]|nr:MAG: hypothetical protein A2X67_10435 [Ignavibacteria bacterium GWA2_55_11]OGU47881.1 MAG: hypothetical protein A2X68_07165 [Ignavibacteria bacterium GWC2_56_12]OGU71216.1 MAG: hypothetical protein A3H45_07540 [Ignavibacteria bacterium RIFCSPLOWO2_02_FULL_55_14]HAV24465.1 GxxExxY protein [Bacteroidota bacterium]